MDGILTAGGWLNKSMPPRKAMIELLKKDLREKLEGSGYGLGSEHQEPDLEEPDNEAENSAEILDCLQLPC